MSKGFFYLLGQAIAYLGASWRWTLVFTTLTVAIDLWLFYSLKDGLDVLAMYGGWLSTVLVPEYVLDVHFDCFTMVASRQLLIIVCVFELLFYAMITMLVSFNDSVPVLWGFLLVGHALYIAILSFFEPYFGRVKPDTLVGGYFSLLAAITCLTDLGFLLVTLVRFERPLTTLTIVVFAAITFVSTTLGRERIRALIGKENFEPSNPIK